MLQDKYGDVIITKSDEEIIFSVNAMVKDGAQRQQYRDELQQMVINAPVVEETFTVPIRWLVLEMEVSRMSTDGIVSIGDCYKVAENLRMTEEETNLALKYFTDIAIHLHYPSAVPHILFTQMKPIVDRLSALISTSFTHSKLGPAGARKKLKESGLFNKKDLHKICEVGESVLVHDQFTNDNFLELLQHLHIAVHISEDDYFLPCALSLSDDSQSFLESSSCDPIIFSWDKKIVIPHSFFPTLIANLLQEKADFILPKFKKEQKRHRVVLKEPQIPGGICLVDATQWIELHYYGKNCTHCPALRRIIEQSISKVAEILHLPHMATPQLGFICNGLICDITEDRHICTLTKRTHEVSCGVDTDIVNEERKLCWLPQDISQSGKIYFMLISKIMPLKAYPIHVYSTSSLIRTSLIRILDYPNALDDHTHVKLSSCPGPSTAQV